VIVFIGGLGVGGLIAPKGALDSHEKSSKLSSRIHGEEVLEEEPSISESFVS